MKIFRFITGPDDDQFCHRVTKALNGGWTLHGGPSLTYDPERKTVICGQAVTKEVVGVDYEPTMKLGEY